MTKTKSSLILIILLFLPLLTQATACTRTYDCTKGKGFWNEEWSCINHQCQLARCGDGYCNDCEFSPCGTTAETQANCPKDCGNPITPTPKTSDSDQGKNYYTKGTTIGKNQTKTDTCQNGQLLTEYYLDSDNNTKSLTVVCNHGCQDGVCKKGKGCAEDTSSEIKYSKMVNLFGVSNPARTTTNISAPNWGRSARFYELPIDIPAGKECFLQFNLAHEMLYPYNNNFLVSDTKFTTFNDAWDAYFTGLCKQGPDDIDPKTGFCKNGYNFAKKTTFKTSNGKTANIFANNDPSYGSNSTYWSEFFGKVPSGSNYYIMIVGESPEGVGVWRFAITCGWQ